MKIAIFGSAEDVGPGVHKKAKEIGKILANRGHTIITGACPGLPYESVKSAFEVGGKTIGFSPACSKLDHVNKFEDPVEFHSELVFVPKNYEHVCDNAACYKYRNISSVLNSDKVIIIGGRYGTLNEFTIAYEFGKEIGVLSDSGGVAGILNMLTSHLKKETGSSLYFSKDVKKLLEKLGV